MDDTQDKVGLENNEDTTVDIDKKADETPKERMFTQTELDRIIKDRLDKEKRASERRADEVRRAAEAEAAEKNGEWQKLAETRAAELAELQQKLSGLELTNMRNTIAQKYNIPAVLANRLQGATEEEITRDAEELLAALPKEDKTAKVGPTKPGGQTLLTRDAIEKMTPAQINENWEAVQLALSSTK